MRGLRLFPAAVLLVFVLLAAAIFLRKPEEMLTGQPQVKDGDSLVINGREMRLKGLDAPEWNQTCRINARDVPCGRMAADALKRWFTRGAPICTGTELDRYGRLLVTCRVNGVDVGADLVRNGIAVDYGNYPEEENAARANERGIWAGTFERPDAFRRRMRAERDANAAPRP